MARERARRFIPTLIVVGIAALVGGCNLLNSLTGPATSVATFRKYVPQWSPYVVIQPDSAALNGYRQALTNLTATGAVQGARIQLTSDGGAAPTVNQAMSFGLEVVGIMDNSDLLRPDVEQAFDQYRAAYPQVRLFQVGNEVTTWPTPMTAEAYVDVLARIYAHVIALYPDVTLLSASTFGAGNIGAGDLSIYLSSFQARGLSPSRLIVALNVYTDTAITAYSAVLPGLPGGYRIWVTETGIADQTAQLNYVTTTYPRLTSLLGAERIYWYALWAGDTGMDSDYSLIKSPTSPPIAPGPLFQSLTKTS